jgi:hypothetical protein
MRAIGSAYMIQSEELPEELEELGLELLLDFGLLAIYTISRRMAMNTRNNTRAMINHDGELDILSPVTL